MSNLDKTGILLINLGTPDSPAVPDVRKYLREFLMDPRVIDISALGRWFLVNLIIAPFRSPKSAAVYRKLWTDKGSPLLFHGVALKEKLQHLLGDKYHVELAMRYQSPSIENGINILAKYEFKKIIVVPLFPQYASASTGSVLEEVMRVVSKRQLIPEIKFISNYFDHPLFIKAFAQVTAKHLETNQYDHILFSYHGLPERQIRKGDAHGVCLSQGVDCCATIHSGNYFCYRAQCFATTRLLAKELNLQEGSYTTMFQSRLGRDPWIKPYADDIIKLAPSKGYKKVLCLVPSFIADCLETTIEVGEEYKELFEHNGGEHWQFVESLNTHDTWVQCLQSLIEGK